jgi:repressor LexA
MTDIQLTDIQQQVLDYIRGFSAVTGYPPTRSEIAAAFDWSSVNAAENHVRALERKGAITIAPGASRGIKVII